MPADNRAAGSLTQAASASSTQKSSYLHVIDRPSDAEITTAWRLGQAARTGKRRAGSNPHDDWWLGTAWADGWHMRDCPLEARRWRR